MIMGHTHPTSKEPRVSAALSSRETETQEVENLWKAAFSREEARFEARTVRGILKCKTSCQAWFSLAD